jgi:hypothetical protein
MGHWWDRETTRLRCRIDELEKQNEKLRGMLSLKSMTFVDARCKRAEH